MTVTELIARLSEIRSENPGRELTVIAGKNKLGVIVASGAPPPPPDPNETMGRGTGYKIIEIPIPDHPPGL